MAVTNRDIAIQFLDEEIRSGGPSHLLRRVKKALSGKEPTQLKMHVVTLVIDPSTKEVTLEQHWDACEPELFKVDEFIALAMNSRRRRR